MTTANFAFKSFVFAIFEMVIIFLITLVVMVVSMNFDAELRDLDETSGMYLTLQTIFTTYLAIMGFKMYKFKMNGMNNRFRITLFVGIPLMMWFTKSLLLWVFLVGLVIISTLSWYEMLVLKSRKIGEIE